MMLRNLHTLTTTHRSVNNGSNKYPDWGEVREEETTTVLQFSTDDGVTWENVPNEYDYDVVDLTRR